MIFEPYKIKKPEESDYLIAYIDLLGTKEYIDKGEDDEIFSLIYEAFTIATKFVESKSWGFDDLKLKIFSDNILVAIKCEKKELADAFENISAFLIMLFSMFVMRGVFFRGGITYGKLAIDDTIVWGKGLVEAVQLEEKIAIYPRIVLSSSLVELLKSFLQKNENFEKVYSCFTDCDGCAYLDYFYYGKESNGKMLDTSNKFTDEKLSVTKNPRVVQKYLWHKNYLKLVEEKFDSSTNNNLIDNG